MARPGRRGDRLDDPRDGPFARLNVVAEGVETAQQHEYLPMRGCDEIQGFCFARPLEPEPCLEYLSCHELGRSQRSIA